MVVSVQRERTKREISSYRYRLLHCLCWPAVEGICTRTFSSLSELSSATTTDQCHSSLLPQRFSPVVLAKMLTEYTYVFAIGTFFALLEAYNNGANDGYVTKSSST